MPTMTVSMCKWDGSIPITLPNVERIKVGNGTTTLCLDDESEFHVSQRGWMITNITANRPEEDKHVRPGT